MKRFRIVPQVLLAFVAAGCAQKNPVTPAAEEVVVRGYLYAGEPVTDIQLTRTLPLGSQETEAPPINDAEVSLEKNGATYAFVPSPGDSGYYHYPGTDLTVQAGDVFRIHVRSGGRDIKAETTVPAAPDSVTLSADSLALSAGFGPPGGVFPDTTAPDSLSNPEQSLTVSWKREASALYYVVVECVETDPDSISSWGGFGGGGPGRMVSSPTNENRYRISRSDVSFLGRHRVRVYRINQEYADLYESRQQDSRDLNEPLTNIENGLGVFSAFSSSVAYFTVIQE
jgi:hypothetical protein